MRKITLYSESGGSIEIDDTPKRRQWAKGKGYTIDEPPVQPEDGHVVYPDPEPDLIDDED